MCSRENQRLAEYCNPNLRVLKRSSKLGKRLSQAPRAWLKECGRLAPRNALGIAIFAKASSWSSARPRHSWILARNSLSSDDLSLTTSVFWMFFLPLLMHS